MKLQLGKLLLSVVLMCLSFTFSKAQVVGVGTTAPDPLSILDVSVPDSASSPQGMLLPRLWQQNIDDLGTSLGLAQKGMIVYNLDSNCVEVWKGTSWSDCGNNSSGTPDYWSINGNTASTGDFIGTVNNVPVEVRVNNTAQAVFTGTSLNILGAVGIGYTNPMQKLEAAGDVIFGGGSSDADGNGEFIQIKAESDSWYIGAQNETSAALTDFYIGQASDEDGTFIIEHGGDVGIGLNTPNAKLHINDAANTSATFKITHSGLTSINNGGWDFQLNNTSANLLLRENLPMNFGVNSTNDMTLTPEGNLAIGTGTSKTKLNVHGGLAIKEFGEPGVVNGSLIDVGNRSFISIEVNTNVKIALTDGVESGQILVIANIGPATSSVILDQMVAPNVDVNGTIVTLGSRDTITLIWSGALKLWLQASISDN